MRARVVSLRDIHEKYKAEVKRFAPAFIIPRHAPGWDTIEGAEAGSFVYRTTEPSTPTSPTVPTSQTVSSLPAAKPVAIEIRRRA